MNLESRLSSSTDSPGPNSIEQAAGSFAKEIFDDLSSAWKGLGQPLEKMGSAAQSILGDFALFDNAAAESNGFRTRGSEQAQLNQFSSNFAKNENDWTVMVQLDASVGDNKDPKAKNSSKAETAEESKKTEEPKFDAKATKLEQIKNIAAETAGKSIAVVVQISSTDATDGKNYLERYVIKNGEIQPPLGKAKKLPAEGSARDIESLERFALEQEPAKRVALIDNVHGQGNSGTTGDADIKNGKKGPQNVQENSLFIDSVLAGLKGSGHEHLDLLDMDACMMGQDGFLRSASAVTDNLVASVQGESVPGQNIGKIVSNLAENTSIKGDELAREIVDGAENGDNRFEFKGKTTSIVQGTQTLAYYDLTKLNQFDQNLDRFDQDLLDYVKEHPEYKELLLEAFRGAKDYGAPFKGQEDYGKAYYEKYAKSDLKQILDGLEDLIETGKIEDTGGVLSHDIAGLKAAEDQLVVKSFADTEADEELANTGGLSVYVPNNAENFTEREQKGSLDSWNSLVEALGLKANG